MHTFIFLYVYRYPSLIIYTHPKISMNYFRRKEKLVMHITFLGVVFNRTTVVTLEMSKRNFP